MRIPFLTAACAALLFALPATAQKITVFGGSGEVRNAATVFLFPDEGAPGAVFVQHGQPKWKAEYDKAVANPGSLAGMQRLGKNWWTSFQNSVELDWAGTKIPAGSWVLGLQIAKDGGVALAIIDSAKAMKSMSVFDASTYKADITVPLTLKKDVETEAKELMAMSLEADSADPTKITFTIAWGKHALVGNFTAQLAKAGK